MESDRLLLKYKGQLVTFNEKIDALQPLVDFSDLSEMRDDVVNVLEKRITAIDLKLAEFSKKYQLPYTGFSSSKSKMSVQQSPSIIERNGRQQEREVGEGKGRREEETETQSVLEHDNDYYAFHKQYAVEEEGQKNNRKRNILYKGEQISEYISEGKNIDKLQEEIMEALSRLEQTGMDNNENQHDNLNEVNNNNSDNESDNSQYVGIRSSLSDRSCLRQLR